MLPLVRIQASTMHSTIIPMTLQALDLRRLLLPNSPTARCLDLFSPASRLSLAGCYTCLSSHFLVTVPYFAQLAQTCILYRLYAIIFASRLQLLRMRATQFQASHYTHRISLIALHTTHSAAYVCMYSQCSARLCIALHNTRVHANI